MNNKCEILEKLATRTITYFNDDLGLDASSEFSISAVEHIEYYDVTTLISLSNDMAGTIGMSVTNHLSEVMVENFIYGEISQEEIEELASENVAETLNITLGNILKELTVIQKGGNVNISTPYTMHNAVNITKKKNGIMYLCKLKSNEQTILLSYFV